ncbi:MAG: reverse transcriptase/maturase family protein, partial [Patescibacteria group bacterium]
KQLNHKFDDIISLENLCLAWEEFVVGKKKKRDVLQFSRNLMDNIVELHENLVNHTYRHGGYESFFINDPKRRHIHKASVRDRLIHQAIYRVLYPFFERTFIGDSYSCRLDKGTHLAINRFRTLAYKVSRNHYRTCWVLKCDIKKFFSSIDHQILLNILDEYILDKDIMWLLGEVVKSFNDKNHISVGLPLGNLTSQLFANVYMNFFDQFVKHQLKAKYYIRYADDFVFLSPDKLLLKNLLVPIINFLFEELKLTLHPNKIFLQTIFSGMDFLGWQHFADHRALRNTTRKRMARRIKESPTNETLQSYLGLLKHGNSLKARNELLNKYWLWKEDVIDKNLFTRDNC